MKFEGIVIEGRKLGRDLGFPTANVELPEGLSLPSGVYFARVEIVGIGKFWAATNIGTNPTVGEVKQRSESYILDFEGDIYGKSINIELIKMLREEQKYSSVEQLIDQIKKDVEQVNLLSKQH